MSERRLAAIMFTDIVGYTTLMGSDEDRAFEVLHKNRDIHSKFVTQFKGTLIKEMGDGMLVSFNLASDAVRCAIEIQKACRKQDIPLKIGIHEGEMVFEGADVLGDGVNIASRLQELAGEGCVCISGPVYHDIKNKARIETEFIGEKSLKNVDEPIKVYKVRCEEGPARPKSHNNLKKSHGIKGLPFLKVKTVIISVLVVLVLILIYPKIFLENRFEEIKDHDGRISIAVMPFENLSGDTLYNIWQGGFQNLLISTLSNSKELSVRQYQTMREVLESKKMVAQASISPSIASELALKLETKTFVLGNILKAGNRIRVNAQLMNTETEEIFKTYQVDGNNEDDVFAMADSLSGLIKNYLEIKKLSEQNSSPYIRGSFNTNSAEAFRYYIRGYNAFMDNDFQASFEWGEKALEIDSGFISVYVGRAFIYSVLGNSIQAKIACREAYKKRDELPIKGKLMVDHLNAHYFGTPDEQIKYLKQILEIEEMNTLYWYFLGLAYYQQNQFKEAAINFEKAIEIHKKFGTNYRNPFNYTFLGESYHKLNKHNREKEIYELGLSVYPSSGNIIRRQAICALSQGDTDNADIFIAKYKSVRKNNYLWSEAEVYWGVGHIYREAHILDKAEESYRQAHKLDPQDPEIMASLAGLLIKNDINIIEGLDLINEALKFKPDDWYYLDTKGWGLYKQGRYEESLKVLTDAWEIRPVYDHSGYLHIQEVEKVVAKKHVN